eukprot:m.245549 g.245549  ORF g.245549 m.245549 type:complete len:74 (+) comp15365_c1_seq46:38-259(+)
MLLINESDATVDESNIFATCALLSKSPESHAGQAGPLMSIVVESCSRRCLPRTSALEEEEHHQLKGQQTFKGE